ncbi:scavenger receptor class B member 1-like isoform X2 [Euwallacea fornicatus]|uniref:scavenger receptor class B member 1-like isoform X2 n=1 Tax=Euwallacea fornicatus TaxID=995702 RepID=UPI00338EECAC
MRIFLFSSCGKHCSGVISLVAVGLLMVCTSTLMFVHNPRQTLIGMILNLSEGSLFFNLWSNPPYEVFVKVYMFNITNAKEFLSGSEKMNVSEVGPYVYREVLTNENGTLNSTDGTVTYYPHREFFFVPEKSIGDPHEDHMMTTNIPLVGLQAFVYEKGFFASLALTTLSKTLASQPIKNLSVHEYLWGYKDTLLTYANTFLPHWIDFNTFGIFERLMSKDNGNVATIVNEPKKYHSPTESLFTETEKNFQYHIAKWNHLASLKDWGYEHLSPEEVTKCHLVEGSFDGTIFPRNIKPNQTIKLFRRAFCRPVQLAFVKEMVGEYGFRQYEYQFAKDVFNINEENKCYCYKNNCMNGFQSIAPCYYGIPISLSQPHFLNVDPKMVQTVNGLNPSVEKHGSVCVIQPELGIPLSGSMKVQVNLDVRNTMANHVVAPFNGLQVPLFWLEITTTDLPSIVIFLLYLLCNVLPVALEIAKYLLLLGGLALVSGSALYTLVRTKVQIPASISLGHSDYTSIPIISIPNEFIDKCEKRFSLK